MVKLFRKIKVSIQLLTHPQLQGTWNALFTVVFSTKKTIRVQYKGKQIIMPATTVSLGSINEIFIEKAYGRLQTKGTKVLDLGAYIGDTATYFVAEGAACVESYEPNRYNYNYLKKNTVQYSQVKAYQKAVTANKEKKFMNHQNISLSSSTNTSSGDVVDTARWKTIIQKKFDILKMDIEGGEYEIIEEVLTTKQFPFLEGCIEFHPRNQQHDKLYNRFENFLKKKYNLAIEVKENGLFLLFFHKK